jgi:two-component system nitrate/nitrite response regulator NarL
MQAERNDRPDDARTRDIMKVLIVDERTLVAEAVQVALGEQGIDDVVVVMNDDLAIEAIMSGERDRAPDVVLMDLGATEGRALDAGRELIDHYPDVKVLGLSATPDPSLARQAVRSGFRGCISRDTGITRLVSSLRAVADGEVLSPQMPPKDAEIAAVGGNAKMLAAHLTTRERETLTLLAEGATSDDIAVTMGISRNTVRTHVQSVLSKLGVHSRLEAAAFAVRHGLVGSTGLR